MRVPFLISTAAILLAACGPQGPSDADVMAGNVPGEDQSAADPAMTPQTGLSVVITSVGDRKVSVIRALRDARPGMGLAEAKALVETPNATVASGLSAADATALQDNLQAAGATVSVQ